MDPPSTLVRGAGVARGGVLAGRGLAQLAGGEVTDYATFLATKARRWTGVGPTVAESALSPALFPFQRRLVTWALRKGRAALFADTGLGKTRMQLEWARHIPGRVLILAPLCVAHQTQGEGRSLGLEIGLHVNSGQRIEATNYERLHQINPADYAGVVLDESSILKSLDGKTRTRLIAAFKGVPYRLCCTATPAPNDVTELTNHAEFLGIMTRAEMLSTWFVHDTVEHTSEWRLKRHARAAFARWLASWALFLRRPSDLGFSDAGYALPPLSVREILTAGASTTTLFPEMGLSGIGDRQRVRRESVAPRVAAAVDWITADPSPFLAWCGLNLEQEALVAALNGHTASVSGADDEAHKEAALLAFLSGTKRGLVTKARIAGFGLNLQHCARMAFVGLSDSFEAYYQAVRRCWRFGQTRPVEVVVIVSDAERGIVDNVQRKQREYEALCDEMVAEVREQVREEVA